MITIIETDDWKAWWINDDFEAQNHHISLTKLIGIATANPNLEIEYFWCDDDRLMECGRFPEDLNEVKRIFKLEPDEFDLQF